MNDVEVSGLDLDSGQAARVARIVLSGLWHQYKDSSLALVEMPFTEVTPVSRYVTDRRLAQASRLVAAYDRAGLTPFTPAYVHGSEGAWLTFPPIVESSEQGRFLLDGTHRVRTMADLGRSPLVLQLRRAFFDPLPCSPTTWDAYTVVRHQPTMDENLANLDPRYFRPLTTYFNSLRFDSLAEARRQVRLLLVEDLNG